MCIWCAKDSSFSQKEWEDMLSKKKKYPPIIKNIIQGIKVLKKRIKATPHRLVKE